MRKSICSYLMLLPVLSILLFCNNVVDGKVNKLCKKHFTNEQVDNAWIKVHWTHGGFYWHNTLTRDDRDTRPPCLSDNCPFKKK